MVLIVNMDAVSMLFLFVVMMFNMKLVELKENTTSFMSIGIVIAVVFLWQSPALLMTLVMLVQYLGWVSKKSLLVGLARILGLFVMLIFLYSSTFFSS